MKKAHILACASVVLLGCTAKVRVESAAVAETEPAATITVSRFDWMTTNTTTTNFITLNGRVFDAAKIMDRLKWWQAQLEIWRCDDGKIELKVGSVVRGRYDNEDSARAAKHDWAIECLAREVQLTTQPAAPDCGTRIE